MKKTKIIATHGPAIQSEADMVALYDAWVNIIRFNFSHAKYENVAEVLKSMRKLNSSWRTWLSMLMDTKGPEIRTWEILWEKHYKKWDVFQIYVENSYMPKDDTSLFCDYKFLLEDISVWQIIDIDSGLFQVKVLRILKQSVEVEAQNSADIGSRRHVNLPGVRLRMPGITQKDKKDIAFAVEQSMDFIAQSFVRSAENIQELREYLKELWVPHIKIIAKIENREGLDNIVEIVREADGIMVARGDLGIEVPIEKLPTYQMQILQETMRQGKFSIIATHLLESMIYYPFPTRAEVSDVYQSVFQRTDALMLSGETAAWKYPHKATKIMTATIIEAEQHVENKQNEICISGLSPRDKEKQALIKSAINAAEDLKIEGVCIFTKSGKLARLASIYRSQIPLYCFTWEISSLAYMQILYGVFPFFLPNWDRYFEKNVSEAIDICKKYAGLKKWDRIIIVNDIQKDSQEIPIIELLEIQ